MTENKWTRWNASNNDMKSPSIVTKYDPISLTKPWPLLPLSPTLGEANTLWSDKNVCSAFCKRYKNKSLPSSERSTLSAENKSGLSMRDSGNLVHFLSNLFCKDATALFVHSLNFSKAIRFLPILQNTWANSGTKLKLWLATVWKCFAVLIILMRSLIDLAACCIRILLSPQWVDLSP